jgi:hypothetical protein
MKLASLVSFRTIWLAGVALAISAVAFSATVALTGGLPVPTTATDFRQYGSSFSSGLLPMQDSPNCSTCHGGYDVNQEPYTRWASSMMAQSVRDPVFQAAFAIANQDLGQSGYLCLRCHVPGAWLGGRAAPDGSAVDPSLGDHDGVNCHVCHRMIDPFYEPGVSPAVDQSILASIGPLPFSVGGGQMVIDPDDVRRGPFDLGPNFFLHDWLPSPFHRESLMCATCHEVSNPATSRMPDGSYELNAYHTRHPTADKLDQFPNERTYSEWAQSVYAQAPIETNGRFGGNVSSVSTCQDCHMPKTTGTACQPVLGGAVRNDLPLHDFHGANSWVLDAVRNLYPDNVSGLSAQSVADAHARNAAYLANASDLDLYVVGTDLGVRVVNHAGHKLPTGYSEGRRMWINVRFFDSQDNLVAERGAYDGTTATLTTADTKVYEANHGLDATMAAVTGQPEAPSLHFMLTNKIYKDNRIPPRGFSFDAFEAVQSEPVAASYAEQQYWDDTLYSVPGAGQARGGPRLPPDDDQGVHRVPARHEHDRQQGPDRVRPVGGDRHERAGPARHGVDRPPERRLPRSAADRRVEAPRGRRLPAPVLVGLADGDREQLRARDPRREAERAGDHLQEQRHGDDALHRGDALPRAAARAPRRVDARCDRRRHAADPRDRGDGRH